MHALAPALQQTRDEVRVLRSLAHPNVIQYHSCFTDGGVQYIAMEYAEVRPLQSWLLSLAGWVILPCDSCAGATPACLLPTKTQSAPSAQQTTPPLDIMSPHPWQEGDLEKMLKARAGELLPEGQLMMKFVQLCLGLQHVHAKVRLRGCTMRVNQCGSPPRCPTQRSEPRQCTPALCLRSSAAP